MNQILSLIKKITLVVVFLCVCKSAESANLKPINLLQIDELNTEKTMATACGVEGLKNLTDGNPDSTATINMSLDTPIDIIYEYKGTVVSPQKLTIQLSEESEEKELAGRIEILASSLSANAGYQSLRVDSFKKTKKLQSFSFSPVAAGWLMIRFRPIKESHPVQIGEIQVMGYKGPPATHYAFKESPADSFRVLERLKKLSQGGFSISDDEKILFTDAKDGKLDEWSFAEASLFACGITDAVKRKTYLKRIDALEAEAHKVVDKAKSPFEKGEKLLKWLHHGPMSKGYVSEQTDISAILDNKTFNCVSSATFYNILGKRLGLDVRAIEVPDHALSILYDGTNHADVETTCSVGFNPERDPRVLKEFEEKTGFSYIPYSHQSQRREIRETGLIAVTYYNHGVFLLKDEQFHQAMVANFKALSLDSEFSSAVQNTLAALGNWSLKLSKDKNFSHALEVIGAGLDLAPKDYGLLHNRKVIWHNWAQNAIDSGNSDEALNIYQRAHTAVPEANFLSRQSWVFISPGEKLVDSGKWEEALELADSGFPKLKAQEAQDELKEWKMGLFLRWSNSEIKKSNFAKSLKVLDKAIVTNPKEKRFVYNIGYITQEWAESVYKKEGAEEAERVLIKLIERYSDIDGVKEAAVNYVYRLVDRLNDSSDYENAAFAAIQRCGKIINNQDKTQKLIYRVYDNAADRLKDKGKWQEAVRVYENALKKYPDSSHLQNNAVATWDYWAKSHTRADEWSGAMDVYEKALKSGLDDSHFKHNLGYIVQKWADAMYEKEGAERAETLLAELLERHPDISQVKDAANSYAYRLIKKLKKSQEYEKEALKAIGRCSKLLTDDKQAQNLIFNLYYNIAKKLINKGAWEEAIGVYEKAFKNYPDDNRLRNNILATWSLWIKKYIRAGEWAKALDVCDKAVVQSPEPDRFKQQVAYITQKWSWSAYEKQGAQKAESVLIKLIERYPDNSQVKEAATGYVYRLIDNLKHSKEYKRDAFAAIERCQNFINDKKEAKKLIQNVYDTLANNFIKKKEWQAALDVYEEAIERYPDRSLFKNNLKYCEQKIKGKKANK